MKIYLTLFACFFISFSMAQNLVYKQKTPRLEVDTFNYQWMLSSAESQNLLKDPDGEKGYEQQSELERFRDNLNSQLLSYLSRELFDNQFGTGTSGTGSGTQNGVYTLGVLSVELYESNLGLVVNILDILTGEETQVIIPRIKLHQNINCPKVYQNLAYTCSFYHKNKTHENKHKNSLVQFIYSIK